MKILPANSELTSVETEAIVLGYFEDHTPESTSRILADSDVSNHVETLAFAGKYKELAIIPSNGQFKAVVLVGLGGKESFTEEKLRNSFSKGLSAVDRIKKKTVTLAAPGVLDSQKQQLELAFVSEITLYDFSRFKSNRKEVHVNEVSIYSEKISDEAIRTGTIMGQAMNLTRDLANMPASSGTPSYFESVAKQLQDVKLTVFDRKQIEEMGMGGLEAVSRGAHEPPRLLVLEYRNAGDSAPLMFVGKGITFDSGGISIKPSENLFNLKFDKSGASAVLGAIKAVSDLKLRVNVVGLLPLTENLPGGGSYKPGDVITHYNKITSEVISTDAEGRLVLADAMSYGVEKYNPRAVIDIATLTGAKNVALGNNIAAIFSNDEELQEIVIESSKNSWERVWPLPLWDEFKEQIKSGIADIKNSGGRPGGAETAAAFLSYFNGGKPWVHLDMQGRTDSTAQGLSKREFLTAGASGFGTRLLTEVAMKFQQK